MKLWKVAGIVLIADLTIYFVGLVLMHWFGSIN